MLNGVGQEGNSVDFTSRKCKPFFSDSFFSLSTEFLLNCIISYFFCHLPVSAYSNISLLKLERTKILKMWQFSVSLGWG